MRRKWYLLLVVAVVACAAIVAGRAMPNRAAKASMQLPGGDRSTADVLPINQVVLFNSGVGYFERAGEVKDNANVQIHFATSDINDLLKSMVLEDLGGGKINVVSYDSNDPVDKLLRSFALDLTGNPSFGEILNQARGEAVEVTMEATNNAPPATVKGTIIGMESRANTKDLMTITVDILNLQTQSGLKSITLNKVRQVRFLNVDLENEMQQALQVLASAHDVRKKRVDISFKGAGKRRVRLGYVVERPIWKMTYRLRLQDKGKLFLQGWALVENTSDADWNNVQMVLVSGKPISFKMNLYDPLYVPRPTVEPELFASLRPPLYDSVINPPGNIPPGGGQLAGIQGGGFNIGGIGGLGGLGGGLGGGFQIGGFQFGSFQGGFNMAGMQGLPGQFNKYQQPKGEFNAGGQGRLTYEELQKRREQLKKAKEDAKKVAGKIDGLNFKEGIDSVATAEGVGDYFQYRLDDKVSIARRRSAMLPVFNTTIDGEKVSIYNRAVHKRHPLHGLRFKNTSGHPLTQGPITVYDKHNYAGDTRILDVQSNEERLLSYAMDLGVKVFVNFAISPSAEMTYRIGGDQLIAKYNQHKKTKYLLVNRSQQDRLMIIEHPLTQGWTLIDPAKGYGKTNEVYRFEVNVPKEQTVKFDVIEEQPRADVVTVKNKGSSRPCFTVNSQSTVYVNQHIAPSPKMTFKIGTTSMTARYNSVKTTTYFFENHGQDEQKLTLEYPILKGWQLISASKDKIKTDETYRFELKVGKRKTARFEVVEEQPKVDQLALTAVKGRKSATTLYAVAEGIAVKPIVKTGPAELDDVKIVKGQLHVRHKTTESRNYFVQNASDVGRTFTLDHIIRPDWKLIDSKGGQKGPSVKRFIVEVAADKTGMQQIVEEKMTLDDKTALKEASARTLNEYLTSPAASKAVRQAIAKALSLHKTAEATGREMTKVDNEMQRLNKDQARLRDNLKIIPMNAEPYKRFLNKFVEQETRIEELQKSSRELNARLEKQTREYEEFVRNVSAK